MPGAWLARFGHGEARNDSRRSPSTDRGDLARGDRRDAMRSTIGFLGVALLLASCTVGPDFLKPAAPDVRGYAPGGPQADTETTNVAGGEAQRFIEDKDIPGQWWALFHSEPLNQLIMEALKGNPTLDAAQASLRQAQENAAAQA